MASAVAVVDRLIASGIRRFSFGKGPSGVEDGFSGARALGGDRSPMGSRSEESPAAGPSSLRIFALYSRQSNSSSVAVQRE